VALSVSNIERADRPVIGLTTYLRQAQSGVWDVQAAFLPKVYFEAVNRAGGIAVLIPPQPFDVASAHRVLDGLDGLIICGGEDVDPARYGQAAHPTTDVPNEARDATEDALLTAAIERDLPFLGICRGAQMLNVHQGGTLIQHLPDIIGTDRYQKGKGEFNSVPVHVDADSALAGVLDAAAPVNGAVYHHQAIDQTGTGLRVVARTDDDVIQAIELDGVSFGIGVQWHPEQTAQEDARLFEGLVEAANTHRRNR
jgi:putative glutamine amidotransferase